MLPPEISILIVDDMKSMRTMVKGQLRQLGYSNFSEAEDGGKGFAMLEEMHRGGKPAQLVLSDWNMPNTTGIEFLKRVRGDSRFQNLLFVMITAEGELGQVKEAIGLGVTTYIVKPFTAETFQAKLKDLKLP